MTGTAVFTCVVWAVWRSCFCHLKNVFECFGAYSIVWDYVSYVNKNCPNICKLFIILFHFSGLEQELPCWSGGCSRLQDDFLTWCSENIAVTFFLILYGRPTPVAICSTPVVHVLCPLWLVLRTVRLGPVGVEIGPTSMVPVILHWCGHCWLTLSRCERSSGWRDTDG